jgi:hypothetical protein
MEAPYGCFYLNDDLKGSTVLERGMKNSNGISAC